MEIVIAFLLECFPQFHYSWREAPSRNIYFIFILMLRKRRLLDCLCQLRAEWLTRVLSELRSIEAQTMRNEVESN